MGNLHIEDLELVSLSTKGIIGPKDLTVNDGGFISGGWSPHM